MMTAEIKQNVKPLPLWTFFLNPLLLFQLPDKLSSVHYFQQRQSLLHSVSIKMIYEEHISYFRYNFQTRQHPFSIWSEKSVGKTLISWTSLVILKSSAVSSVSLSSATSILTCMHSIDWDFLSFEQKHTIIIIQLSCAGFRQNKWHRST